MDFVHRFDLKTPAPVSAISFGTDDALAVGSGGPLSFSGKVCGSCFARVDDGTVRVYTLPSASVVKAVRGLGHDVSSVVWLHSPSDDDPGTLWVASGNNAHRFALQSENMILGAADATTMLELGEDEEDVLNEVRSYPARADVADPP